MSEFLGADFLLTTDTARKLYDYAAPQKSCFKVPSREAVRQSLTAGAGAARGV